MSWKAKLAYVYGKGQGKGIFKATKVVAEHANKYF